MPLLDAAIAFSLTMLAVATTVSVLIEIAHGVLGHRSDGLKKFLQQFYERELQPALESGLSRVEARVNEAAGAGLHEVAATGSKLRAALLERAKNGGNAHLPPASGTATEAGDALLAEVDEYKLVSVSANEMMDRLKQSQLGHTIYARLDEQADTVFDVIAERYERFGEMFSEGFRKKRQAAALIVSVLLAFAINIDALHLMKAYMLSDDTRDAVIAQSASLLESPQGAPSPAGQDAVSRAMERINALEASPFPVGWQQFPGCPAGSADPRCPQQANAGVAGSPPLVWFSWAAGCLLTGLLAGLGAPFWYNAATSLMSAADRVRGYRQRLVGPPDDEQQNPLKRSSREPPYMASGANAPGTTNPRLDAGENEGSSAVE